MTDRPTPPSETPKSAHARLADLEGSVAAILMRLGVCEQLIDEMSAADAESTKPDNPRDVVLTLKLDEDLIERIQLAARSLAGPK